MPGANLPFDGNALAARLNNIDQAIAALQTTQLFIATDKTNLERVRLGVLKSGDIGLAVTDPLGTTTTEILPVYANQLTGTVTATGSTFQDLGFPLMTVIVGASGKVKITLSSQINAGSVAGVQGGVVSISLDGAASPSGIYAGMLVAAASASAAIAASASVTVIATGLAAGPHTFKAVFQSETPSAVNFINTFMQIQPI
jgi:hypothetical protein